MAFVSALNPFLAQCVNMKNWIALTIAPKLANISMDSATNILANASVEPNFQVMIVRSP